MICIFCPRRILAPKWFCVLKKCKTNKETNKSSLELKVNKKHPSPKQINRHPLAPRLCHHHTMVNNATFLRDSNIPMVDERPVITLLTASSHLYATQNHQAGCQNSSSCWDCRLYFQLSLLAKLMSYMYFVVSQIDVKCANVFCGGTAQKWEENSQALTWLIYAIF